MSERGRGDERDEHEYDALEEQGARLARALRRYNASPEMPAEALWARIEAADRAERSLRANRWTARRGSFWIGSSARGLAIAASLAMFAVGTAVGYFAARRTAPELHVAAAERVPESAGLTAMPVVPNGQRVTWF